MSGFLRDRRLRTKFLMLAGVFLIALAGTIGVASVFASERVLTDRTLEPRAVVDVAYGVAQTLQDDVTTGKLTRDQAQARFRDFVHRVRYGDSNDFLFVIGFDGTQLASAMPANEGKNTWDQQSNGGRYIVRELVAAGRTGSGVVDYAYPRASGGDPVGKRSFVRAFEPWDVVIATGTYTDDLAGAVRGDVTRLVVVALFAMVVASRLAWILARDVTGSLRTLRQRLRSLAAGDHDSAVPRTERRDEIGEMAQALEVVRDAAKAASRLHQEQDASKQQSDTERTTVLLRLADNMQETIGGVVDKSPCLSPPALVPLP